jgi:hypothetical protein
MSEQENEPTQEVVTVKVTGPEGEEVEVELARELADAIFVYGALPVLYAGSAGTTDPNSHHDSFATARQRVLNAINELQITSQLHYIMTRVEQPMAFARSIAEQQAILLFNMLGQAGLLEARAMQQQQEMGEMAEAKIHLPDGVEVDR